MKSVLFAALVFAACREPGEKTEPLEPRHRAAVEALGLKDARRTGYAVFECSDSDLIFDSATFFASATFVAKGADGKPVEGAVCCGLIKGCTVRF